MGNHYSCDAAACQAATDQSKVGACTVTSSGTPLELQLHQNTCTLLGGSFGTPPEPCPADGSSPLCYQAASHHGVGPFGTFAIFNQGKTTPSGLPPPGQYLVYECGSGSCSRTAPAKIPATGEQVPLCLGGGLPPNTTRDVVTVECPGCVKTTPSSACTAAIGQLAGALPPTGSGASEFVLYNNSMPGAPTTTGLPTKGQYVVGQCDGTGPQAVCTVSNTGKIPDSGQVAHCAKNDASKPVFLGSCTTGK